MAETKMHDFAKPLLMLVEFVALVRNFLTQENIGSRTISIFRSRIFVGCLKSSNANKIVDISMWKSVSGILL